MQKKRKKKKEPHHFIFAQFEPVHQERVCIGAHKAELQVDVLRLRVQRIRGLDLLPLGSYHHCKTCKEFVVTYSSTVHTYII